MIKNLLKMITTLSMALVVSSAVADGFGKRVKRLEIVEAEAVEMNSTVDA
jgi:hypothetical protein